LPRVKELTPKRRAAIRTCWNSKKSYQSLEFWRDYFTSITFSDWHMGRSGNWKADFDFCVRHSAFVKIIEADYK
jgi:hypothetical protein